MRFILLFAICALATSLVEAVVQPEQVLLHLTTSPDVVSLSFVTRGGAFSSPLLRYGISSTKLSTTVDCITDAYTTVPTWDPHGAIHTCQFSNVTNMQKYYYRVGSKVQNVWSNVFSFVARHISPDVTRLALAGDSGCFTHSRDVVGALAKRYDLAAYVTVGDLSYSSLTPTDTPVEVRNDYWGIIHQQVLSKFPQVPVYGNHDMYDNNGKVYDHRYNVHVSPDNITKHWFSIDIGGIHLAVIDNLYDQTATSPMFYWLKRDLAAAKAKREAGTIQHIVVSGHYPMYSDYQWTAVLRVLEPIMVEYEVDLYVCGHIHQYERSYPLNHFGTVVQTSKNYYTNPKGVVHVTIGTAGIPLNVSLPQTRRPWQVYKSNEYYGYLLLTSNKTGDLLAEFIEVNGTVRDSFVIFRTPSSSSLKRQQTDYSKLDALAESDVTEQSISDYYDDENFSEPLEHDEAISRSLYREYIADDDDDENNRRS